MPCRHQKCEEAPLGNAEHCWEHLPDKAAYADNLIRSVSKNPDLSGLNLKKVVLKKAHFEKVDFSKADLSQADLTGSVFFDSKFYGADMIGANLSQCELTHCDLKNTDLTKASLAGARLWSADLSNSNLTEADLTEADLWDARLFNVKLWHTSLTGAKSIYMKSFSRGTRLSRNPKINETGTASAEQGYRNLKQYFMEKGKYSDASWASFKEKTMERLTLAKNRDINYFPSFVMNVLCGYGEKPYRIVLSAFFTILAFALIYASLGAVRPAVDGDPALIWSDYIYYSTITFTTVGYGDIIPRPVAGFRLLAAVEAFFGVYLTGLFIFTLARKYSAR